MKVSEFSECFLFLIFLSNCRLIMFMDVGNSGNHFLDSFTNCPCDSFVANKSSFLCHKNKNFAFEKRGNKCIYTITKCHCDLLVIGISFATKNIIALHFRKGLEKKRNR